jgi:SAM-dependent methyltransferase
MPESEGRERDGPEQTADRVRAHYELEKRLAAQLRAATPAERRNLLPDAYGQVSRLVGQSSAGEASASRRRRVAGQMRFLARFLSPAATFCELGPGDCLMVLEVAGHVKHAYAIDIEREYCKTLHGPPNFSVVFTDGTSVPVSPGSIDVAYSDQMMEHLHPDDAAEELKNIFKALKPGGVYICTTPNRLSGPHDVSRYFEETATGFHLKEYTYGELTAVFRDAGFTRFRAYVGGRGRYLRMPLWLARLLERIVGALPFSLRKAVVWRPPIGWLLGIQLVGYKPGD